MIDIDTLNPDDIDALVTNQVPERRALEYKRELPGASEGDKKEFLADVCSFANAGGGLILYGLEPAKDADGKDTGFAQSAPGLPKFNGDADVLRLENLLRDGVEPRIPVARFRPIERPDRDPVLALQVRQSWVRPHMVTFKGTSRFYSRNSAGKYQLDVGEIRGAFLLSDQLGERIRRFRLERLDLIMFGVPPVPLVSGFKVVLHLIPVAAFDPTTPLVPSVPIYDQAAPSASPAARLSPLGSSGAYHHYFNFDGLLWTSSASKKEVNRSYLQIFRNGAIETAWGLPWRDLGSQAPWLPSRRLEKALRDALPAYLGFFKTSGLDGPFVLMLSLLGVNGVGVSHPESPDADEHATIDRDALIVPDVWLERADWTLTRRCDRSSTSSGKPRATLPA